MIDSHNNNAAELAARFINQTSKPVFLTGKAGTGKTTFLKRIIEHTYKNAIIVAPTGIAAINANGVTIHSLFGIPFGLFIPDSSYKIESDSVKINTPYTMVKHLNMRESKRKMLQELELLIIDEVSMLRADLLDTIDFVLRNVRRQNHKPFGGVQVLFIGDLMQLPPVVKEEEWKILKHYYSSIYFFDAKVLKAEKPVYIELDKIYRQSDSTFIDLLNNLRTNRVTQQNIDLLNSYYKQDFDASSALNTITLTTHNHLADTKNKLALQALTGKSFFYYAKIEGEFSESAYPIEPVLELKIGAQVMFVKNDISGRQQYFNGKIGIISNLKEKEIEVDFKDGSKPFWIETYSWKNIKYELNHVTNEIEEIEIGEFAHYPIKLAWAITIHKSQGLTFEKAVLDINRAFAPGQVYVALSRLKSLDGLVLTAPIQFNTISQDKVLTEYTDNKPPEDVISNLIDLSTQSFLKDVTLLAFDFNWIYTRFKQHSESYTMEVNRSAKQKEQEWAHELFSKLEPLKVNADKFTHQLTVMFSSGNTDMHHVLDRIKAAQNYFSPVLKTLSKALLYKIEILKEEKQVKTFLEELLDLENIVYRQQQLIDKAERILEYIINKKEFTKTQFNNTINQLERLELAKHSALIVQNADKGRVEKKGKKSKSEIKPKKEKVLKPDTKSISFELFQSGKSIEEIAHERNFTLSTIEAHLAHYVSIGKLPVLKFVNEKKYKTIMDLSVNNPDYKLGELKEILGDNYSYSEIKFALASLKYIETLSKH